MFRAVTLPVIAASVLLAMPVFAQPAPTDAPPPPAPGAMAQQNGGPQRRLQALHDRLGITPAQQPQWDGLVAALRDNAQAMRSNPAVQALRSGQVSGVARLRAMAAVARVRADALQRMLPAVEALYGVLTPQQQQVADQTMDRMMGGARAHRG